MTTAAKETYSSTYKSGISTHPQIYISYLIKIFNIKSWCQLSGESDLHLPILSQSLMNFDYLIVAQDFQIGSSRLEIIVKIHLDSMVQPFSFEEREKLGLSKLSLRFSFNYIL